VTPRVADCRRCRSQAITPTATFRTHGHGPTERVMPSTLTALKTVTLAVVALNRHLVSTEVMLSSITWPGHEHRCRDSLRLSNAIVAFVSGSQPYSPYTTLSSYINMLFSCCKIVQLTWCIPNNVHMIMKFFYICMFIYLFHIHLGLFYGRVLQISAPARAIGITSLF